MDGGDAAILGGVLTIAFILARTVEMLASRAIAVRRNGREWHSNPGHSPNPAYTEPWASWRDRDLETNHVVKTLADGQKEQARVLGENAEATRSLAKSIDNLAANGR